jgi:hypothetical protein
VSRYDLLLAAMPVPLAAGVGYAAATGLPTAGGLGVGSLLSAILLAYGLFFDAPTR